ncbi:DUF2059 domain-containing protein [Shewanella xiamenensis]|uniref:DUF2059 domain-containing protein n=1 Tax=Shewanella xiamenensis TaxID=332186 RepID=A0AAW6QVL2_9GAMM|nr:MULTISPECIES: DUF2059 domain-containing protein [Shewanella]PZP28410.1 MAG: DUF2059 domain-containing protein [Shewanella oneidensis]ASF14568.1 DUF2059 domain-containing protein [Shewanella sp. FDAARGOS_354]MBW0298340.1 hypothetical protein [Shewanella xiamenensis]MCD8550937.1 DUF2059 domain-containing protein [Shewanella xiamenensis]MCD8558163.1 DUF2059 domain-containing protein [Shewanella xiamenensis]
MKKFQLLPLMLFILSTPVVAQEAPIDEMFRVMSIDKQMAGGFEAMLPIVDQIATNYKLDNKAKEELKGIYRAWFNEDVDRPRVINELKKQYSEAFTNEEIIKITQFYQTSTGKKLLEKTPQLMQTGAQIAMQEAQAKQSKLIERIRPFLAKHGIKE